LAVGDQRAVAPAEAITGALKELDHLALAYAMLYVTVRLAGIRVFEEPYFNGPARVGYGRLNTSAAFWPPRL
jgi:hypothetical protein